MKNVHSKNFRLNYFPEKGTKLTNNNLSEEFTTTKHRNLFLKTVTRGKKQTKKQNK